MPSRKHLTPIVAGATYHIFNRGNNFQKVFFRDSDYRLFMEKFQFYLNACSELLTYALLPNHYHLIIRVNDNIEEGEFSKQFAKFVLSYTNIINIREFRSGGLFLKIFKRLRICDEQYLKRLLFYIHYNPQRHEIISNFKEYTYSSYCEILNGTSRLIDCNEIINWFDNVNGYIEFHNLHQEEEVLKNLTIE